MKKLSDIHMPKFSDMHQQKAFFNIIRFFAIMLILTVAARAMSGATMPTVTTVSPANGVITRQIDITGQVAAAGSVPVTAFEGLTVLSVPIKNGEYIEKDSAIAVFDMEEISEKISMEKALIAQLTLRQNELRQQPTTDSSAAAASQKALDYAYQDYAAAQDELSSLKAQAVPNADAIKAAEEKVNAAFRAAEVAEAARNTAISGYNAAEKAAKTTASSNLAEANILSLNIKEKKSDLNALAALQKADGKLQAPISGAVRSLALAEGQVSGKWACGIASSENGYLFSFILPEEETENANISWDITVEQNGVKKSTKLTTVKLLPNNTAECSVRLKGDKWKDGIADGKITLSKTHHEICLPSTAINQDIKGNFVYIIEEQSTVLGTQNVLVRINVNVEKRGATQAAVTGALTSKSLVVSGSDKPLSNGARVRIGQ